MQKIGAPETNEQPRKARRSSATVNALILNAARQLFAERGYRASTRDIAKLADVPEPLLFRKYGSKPRLFEAAVTESLVEFYESFDTHYAVNDMDDSQLAERAHIFSYKLFDLISENRQLIFAYLSAREFEPELSNKPLSNGLENYFERAERALERRYTLLGVQPTLPAGVTARLSFLTAIAAVLFGSWVFTDEELSRDEFVDELNNFVLRDLPVKRSSRKSANGAKTKAIPGDTEAKAAGRAKLRAAST